MGTGDSLPPQPPLVLTEEPNRPQPRLDVDLGELSLDNYVMLFTDSGLYFRWFVNSVVLTAVQVAGTVLRLFDEEERFADPYGGPSVGDGGRRRDAGR